VLQNAHLGFIEDRRTFWAKDLVTILNIPMFSQESLEHCPLFVVKPVGILLLVEITHSEVSARKLPDLKKSILMCGLDSSSI